MRRRLPFLLLAFMTYLSAGQVMAQNEYGIWAGAANYFGDLNPGYSFRQTRGGGGLFYRYNISNRMAWRVGFNYGNIAASDSKLSGDRPYQSARNLDFRSNIFEMAATFEINFFDWKFGSGENPRDNRKRWTPYFFAGGSFFNFNSYTFYEGNKYFLEPIGTEGQKDPNSADPNGAKGYSKFVFAIPFGGGLKFMLSQQWVMQLEIGSRRTFTDHIDDVGGSYPNVSQIGYFVNGVDMAEILYDRSPELGIVPIGYPDKQRGTSKDKDRFNFYSIGFTYTFIRKKCPTF